jgi:phage terminase large subunit-like protein
VAGFLVHAPWNEALLDEVCSFPNAQYAFADALIKMALGSTFTTMENV